MSDRRGSFSSLSSRERVRLALNHQEPDRIPLDLDGWATYFTEGAYFSMLRYLGLEEQPQVNEWFMVSPASEAVLTRFGVDFRRVGLRAPDGFRAAVLPDGSWSDEWGVRKRRVAHFSPRLGREMAYAELVHSPLAQTSVEDLETYPWPDPADPGRYRGLAEEVRHLYASTQYALVASAVGMGLFEQAQWLRGTENFLMDLCIRPEFARRLIEKILEFQVRVLERYLDIVGPFVELVETSDDYGMQTGLLISPQLYRQALQPSHRLLNKAIKNKTEAKIFLHSCGSISALLDDLIAAGVEVINPVQPRARDMDCRELKQRFGSKVVFHGGVDEQQVLPYGNVEDVREEVLARIAALGPGGGYILAPAHNLQDDVPPQNVAAMFDAAREYGRYPLEKAM
jgi:uroporphyrinogen decarboxylase